MTRPCPDIAKMGDHACGNRDQCWEPCGELGKSEAHAVPAPSPRKTDTSLVCLVISMSRAANSVFDKIHRLTRGRGDDEQFTADVRYMRGLAAELMGYDTSASPSIDMVLFCPECGEQHIDAAEPHKLGCQGIHACDCDSWLNPPHRSHLCKSCHHVWRPADVPTNGVATIKTRGKNDSPIVRPRGRRERW
jgi:hypothetical protein